ALAATERDRQIGDLEQRTTGGERFQIHQAIVLRGSNASRTASPMKISRLSMNASTKNEVSPSHGACRFALPWARSSPSDGEPGGRPKPRKSSAVSAVIEPISTNGRKVSAAVIA